MSVSNVTLVVCILLYAAVTYGLTEVFRRYRLVALCFVGAALCTFPLWAENRHSLFEWVKIFSVLVPSLLFCCMRIAVFEKKAGRVWSLLRHQALLWVLYGVLALNIVEASIQDWHLGYTWNSLAGVCLVLTIPYADKYWRVETRTCGDLIVDFPLGWCFLYTTWNAAFLLGCIPDEVSL
ncbi:hypothetical protein KIPB_013179 [Kipferlia bialata]|uniref:Uncharacterized protein n=1 Tax=Kipferlia bialata TaxID=797122 RepID=A0A9K3D8X4_9EUKA|nr:hypothetical protein KIPB_013179 [Kipferlia bialata]|eukprot:g13179.t1